MADDMSCGCGRPGRYAVIRDGKTLYSCNKRSRCPTYDELREQNKELTNALYKYREAMDLTRQYVGYRTLPAIEGWSWFDADEHVKKILNIKEEYTELTAGIEILNSQG